jgi:hypothetical protein
MPRSIGPVRQINRRALVAAAPAAALAAFASPSLAQVFLQPQPQLQPPQSQQPESSPLRPRALKLFSDTAKGHGGEPLAGDSFVETQQRLLFVVEFDKSVAGTDIDVAIVSVRTTGGLEQVIFASSNKILPDGRLPIELRLPSNWPIGHYAVRLGVNERLIASLPYRVTPAAPRFTPIKANGDIKIVRVSDDGKELLLVPNPKANMRTLNFMLDTTGSNTGGVDVAWTLTAVKTSAGDNVEVGNSAIADWPLENTRLTFDAELPRDWPTGQYRVEVKIGSQLLSALRFEVLP